MAFHRFFKPNDVIINEYEASPLQTWESGTVNLVKKAPKNTNQVVCNLSPQYISWRYEKNPLFRYNYFTDSADFLMISRIKKHSFGRELRLVEFILLNSAADLKKLNKELGMQVRQFCKINKIDFISLSGLQYSQCKSCFNWMGIIPVRALGPSITLKDLNMNEKFNSLLPFENWSYSLGDLELF